MSLQDVIESSSEAVTDDMLEAAAFDMLAEAVVGSREWVTKAMCSAMTDKVRRGKAKLVRHYVEQVAKGAYPDPEQLKMASYLASIEGWISKAQKWEQWNSEGNANTRRLVSRDEKGRFTTLSGRSTQVVDARRTSLKVDPTKGSPIGALVSTDERGIVRPNRADMPENERQAMAAFQGAHEEAVGLARNASNMLGGAGKNIDVEIVYAGAEDGTVKIPLRDFVDGKLPDAISSVNNKLTRIRFVAGSSATDEDVKRLASFKMADSLGGPAQMVSTNLNSLEQLAQERGSSTRLNTLIGRVGVAGKILESTGAMPATARYMQLVGAYGPEVSRMLEPHAKRAAYRYRGTERRPDAALTQSLGGEWQATIDAAAQAINAGELAPSDIAAQIEDSPEQFTELEQSMKFRGLQYPRTSGDTFAMGVRSDLAALELLKTLPKDAKIAELSAKSGHVLPSQGVLIDADGDLISQSVGFAEDHYLPFNLGNMGRARGGQYVRTRQQGGLTGEDIMASVAFGVRSATVASTSGVYRLEFDPAFRGARGASDKAVAMYDRYLSLLQQLEKSSVYSKDISAQDRAEIDARAMQRYPGDKQKEARETYIGEELDRKRADAKQLKQSDIDTLKTQARDEVTREGNAGSGQDLERRVDERFQELYEDAQSARVSTLDLNAEGYAVALQALQQQFPYFIRTVEFQKLSDAGDKGITRDKGRIIYPNNRTGMGFAASRGSSPAYGPKASPRSKDHGYIKPGRLSTTSRAMTEEPPATGQEQTGTGGTGQNPVTPKAPAGNAAATGSSGPAPAPVARAETSAPAARAAVANKAINAEQIRQLVEDFNGNLLKLGAPSGSDNPLLAGGRVTPDATAASPAMSRSWEEMVAPDSRYSDADRAHWLFSHGMGAIREAIENDPNNTFRVLSSREAVSRGLNAFYTSSHTRVDGPSGVSQPPIRALSEAIEEEEPFKAKNQSEMVANMTQAAMEIYDLTMLSQPFTPQDPGLESTNFARAIEYSDLTGMGSAAEVQAYLAKPENAAEVDLAMALGMNSSGEYLPFHEAVANTKARLDAMSSILAKKKTWDADAASRDATMSRPLESLISSDELNRTGLSTEQAAALIGHPAANGTVFGDRELEDYYRGVQRARTLLEVSRALNVPGGGGAFPKGEAVLLRRTSETSKAWSRSRPVRRLAPDHPLSKAVARRTRLGLSPLRLG